MVQASYHNPAWIVFFSLALLTGPGPALARIHLDLSGQCTSQDDTAVALGAILEKNLAESTLDLGVRELPREGGGFVIEIRIVGRQTGVVHLERSLTVEAVDCPRSLELIEFVISGFFEDIPREQWSPRHKEPVPEKPKVIVKTVTETVTRTERDYHMDLSVAVEPSLRLLPSGGALSSYLTLDVGTRRHQLSATLGPRIALPQEIGQGRFFEMFLLAGLGWRYRTDSVLIRANVFTGVVLVHAYDVPGARDEWLFWLEGKLCLLWEIWGLRLGPFFTATPVWQYVSGHQRTVRLAPLQAGLSVEFPLWSR